MYSLKVHTTELDLIECLRYEGTPEGENVFSFSSVERASEVISRYVYYIVKNDCLEKLIAPSEFFREECNSFLLFIPGEYEDVWLKKVRENIESYLKEEEKIELYVEGFMTFRMQDLKEKYFNFMQEEYYHYLRISEPNTSMDSLIEFMNEQPIKTPELYITTLRNGHIVLKNKTECLYVEQDNQQENVIVQSLFYSPEKVRVFDEFDVLKKQFIIVLKQIFGKDVIFEKTEG